MGPFTVGLRSTQPSFLSLEELYCTSPKPPKSRNRHGYGIIEVVILNMVEELDISPPKLALFKKKWATPMA